MDRNYPGIRFERYADDAIVHCRSKEEARSVSEAIRDRFAVHLATTEFTKMAELNLRKGDKIEVTGWKTEFEGVQTIFAREVRHGQDVYVFRDKDGVPAW